MLYKDFLKLPMMCRLWAPNCSLGITSFMDDFGNLVNHEDYYKVRLVLRGY